MRGSYRQPNKKQRKRSTPDHHSGRYGSTGELTEVVTKYDEIGFTETKTDYFDDTQIYTLANMFPYINL